MLPYAGYQKSLNIHDRGQIMFNMKAGIPQNDAKEKRLFLSNFDYNVG